MSAYRKKKLSPDKDAENKSVLFEIDLLMSLISQNCFPGANYQRLKMSTDIAKIMFNSFFDFKPNEGMNKGSKFDPFC